MTDTTAFAAALDSAGAGGQGQTVSANSNGTAPQQNTNATPQNAQQNPLYAEYLQRFPEAMRSVAEPIFKQWDADTTRRFQTLHSETAQYEPYKEIISQYDPESLGIAVQIAQAIESDPQGFIAQLQSAFPSEQGQATTGPEGNAVPGTDGAEEYGDDYGLGPDHPLVQQVQYLQNAINAIAESQLQTQTTQQQQQEDAALAQELEALHGQHGDFDDSRVLAFALANGGDLTAAYEEYAQMVEDIKQQLIQDPALTAPSVLSSGGGLPSAGIDTAKLSSGDTRKLFQQLLESANQS